MSRLVFLAVVAVMVVDVMGQIACPNRMSTDQLRSLSLVQQPVEQLIQKVTDTTLAGQVYDCVTKDGINCAPCRQGELGQIMAVLPVMLTDCQTGNANVCPPDLQAKSAAVVNKVISSYRERYYEIIARL